MAGRNAQRVRREDTSMNRIAAGLAAGAAGTAALNAVTYGDMLLRGRPASRLPARTAEALASKAGVQWGAGERAQNRQEASGALLGVGAGLEVGALYAWLRPRWRGAPFALAALALAAGAMLAGDAPPVALRLTDPRTWGASGWVSDLVPHLAYGLVAAAVFDALWRRR
jgi:xanthosine utilization system XapX-like protein